jgi:hypothetical protein
MNHSPSSPFIILHFKNDITLRSYGGLLFVFLLFRLKSYKGIEGMGIGFYPDACIRGKTYSHIIRGAAFNLNKGVFDVFVLFDV